jgi:hypothetical protein
LRLRQEACEFKASLGYIVRPYFKTSKQTISLTDSTIVCIYVYATSRRIGGAYISDTVRGLRERE